jgi:hypothetical protein
MGFISSMFSKEERNQRSFEKSLKAVLNPRIQTEERFGALYNLRKNGSDQAIYGLLKRFTITATSKGGSVVDEEEKTWVFSAIHEFGQAALPSLTKFIMAKEGPAVNPVHSISQCLDLMQMITKDDPQYVLDIIEKLIIANPEGYERDPIRKEEVLNFLIELKNPVVAPLVTTYLLDMNETIRFLTVELLFALDDEEVSREPLLKLFDPDNDESLRIRNRMVLGFANNGWSIKGYRSFVEPSIKKDEYSIQRGDKIIKRKGHK